MAEETATPDKKAGDARIWIAEIEKAEKRDEKTFIRRVAYFPTRLTNAQLQAMTR